MTTKHIATDSWFRSEPCLAHSFVATLISDYVRKRQITVTTAVDLWATTGQLLQPVSQQLNCHRAVGVVPRPEDVRGSKNHELILETVLARPEGIEKQALPSPELILGIPPWHWKPKHIKRLDSAGEPVQLTDDPANVAIIDACRTLPYEGLGCFIVGAGLLMRPGPGTIMANFAKFGLFVDGVIALPRGSTSPDLGAGQLMLVISRMKREEQVFGRLQPDRTRLADLLAQ